MPAYVSVARWQEQQTPELTLYRNASHEEIGPCPRRVGSGRVEGW